MYIYIIHEIKKLFQNSLIINVQNTKTNMIICKNNWKKNSKDLEKFQTLLI